MEGFESESKRAPTVRESTFHLVKSEFGEHSIARAVESRLITDDDATLIRQFIAELRASNGISVTRANKLTYPLIVWRRYLPHPFREITIDDIFRGIEAMKQGKYRRLQWGKRKHVTEWISPERPYKQSTIRDNIKLLKRFFKWLIENGYSTVPQARIERIRPPNGDSMTVTVNDILTEEEIIAILRACQSSRDRAMIMTLYDGGLRSGELATLTWGQVRFDGKGIALNVNAKGRPRYVRLWPAVPFLRQWKRDYPYRITSDALVFVSAKGRPLTHAAMAKQVRVIAHRGGIQKHIHLHLFRHTKVTHLMQEGKQDSIIKAMVWGNQSTKMLATYGHLSNNDIDNALLPPSGDSEGRSGQSVGVVPQICPRCSEINGSTAESCRWCGCTLTGSVEARMDETVRLIEAHPLFHQLNDRVRTLSAQILREEGSG